MSKPKVIKIDDVEYIRADEVPSLGVKNAEGLEYCIIRTDRAGVFAGYIANKTGNVVEILQSRRYG